MDCRKDFALEDDHVWLNCAHQGPIPLVAATAAESAIEWKKNPYKLTGERFSETPAALRRAIARLIHANVEDVVLANSASYGLHLLAHSIRWRPGDEVIVMEGDFPSDILPWLLLESKGVSVKRVRPAGYVLQQDEFKAALTARTRLVCLTWVHSFSGWTIDLNELGSICRDRAITFVVNCSQAIGARPIDVGAAPIDAITCVGFKWLCGPYGTGFCWLRKELRESLESPKAYWLSMFTAQDLAGNPEVVLKMPTDARPFDIFGTANFFNFVPWTASIEYLLGQTIEKIGTHDQALVSRLLSSLDRSRYRVLSPEDGPFRSTLVLICHKDESKNQSLPHILEERRIHVAVRTGRLRISPHLYNNQEDIDRISEVLNQA